MYNVPPKSKCLLLPWISLRQHLVPQEQRWVNFHLLHTVLDSRVQIVFKEEVKLKTRRMRISHDLEENKGFHLLQGINL